MKSTLYFALLFMLVFSICKAEPLNNPEELTEKQKIALVKKAAEARTKAYAPYSNFLVGAAVLTSDGQMIGGSNIENASYGLAICAERTALFKAVSEGHTYIKAIAVVVPGNGSPCGACRQVMNEFNPRMPVLYGNLQGKLIRETTLQELLPEAFGPHNLEKNCPCK